LNTQPKILNHQILAHGVGGSAIRTSRTDHHNLLKFDDSEVRRRFQEGHAWFEKYLGRKPAFIAYPYGYCNQRVETAASHYFSGGFTVSHGKWHGATSRYALNRLSIKNYLTGRDIIEIIHGDSQDRWSEIENRAPWRRKATAP
jgi:peptidoglycan/xylan/chitin deacetylase (PgdA/CDA1 family)